MCWRRAKRKRDVRNKKSLQGFPESFRQRLTSTRQTAACPGHKLSVIINLHDLIRPAKWPRIAFAAKACRQYVHGAARLQPTFATTNNAHEAAVACKHFIATGITCDSKVESIRLGGEQRF